MTPAAEAAYLAIRNEYSRRGRLLPDEPWARILAQAAVEAVEPVIAAGERERIAHLATTEAAAMRASNFAEHEVICAAALEDFADLIREQS